jgi:hypothetical protein
MKKTFFDYISSADSEKVHSQTIGWIFSENCKALSDNEKTKILRNITKSNLNFNIQYTLVEVNDIDILIVCDDALVVIENKIKASESETQLPKYFNIIEEGALSNLIENRERFYIYLSLLEDKSSDDNFFDVSYELLLITIRKYFKNYLFFGNRDKYILNDYLNSISQLVDSLKWMDSDITVRQWVFNNTSIKKDDYILNNVFVSNEINYIAINGLVRQMQKFYFKLVKDNLNLDRNLYNVFYGSSANNGEGLIQIDFLNYKYSFNNVNLQIGYQIQSSVVKVNTASENYINSSINQLNPSTRDRIEELKNSINFNRINPPQTKAYYSISKNLPKSIFEYSPKELAEYIELEIAQINPFVFTFWNSIK